MQQGVMEYNLSGVGTIVQSTWWVQCTHVHVHAVYGYVDRKGEGMGGGEEMEQRGV